jgi:hypothetical protein
MVLLSPPLLFDVFVGVAGPAHGTWPGSASGGTLLVVAGFVCQSALPGTFAALAFTVALLDAWGPVLPALAGVFRPFAAGGFAAPTCGIAGAGLLGAAAGFAFSLQVDGCEGPWSCAVALPAFFAAEFVDPAFVGAAFAGAEFVDAELVGAEFAGA